MERVTSVWPALFIYNKVYFCGIFYGVSPKRSILKGKGGQKLLIYGKIEGC